MKTTLRAVLLVCLIFIISILVSIDSYINDLNLNNDYNDASHGQYYNTIVLDDDRIRLSHTTTDYVIVEDDKELEGYNNQSHNNSHTKIKLISDLVGVHETDGSSESNNTNSSLLEELNSPKVERNDDKKYDENQYNLLSLQAMEPKPNISSCAYLHVFWSGFCNQYYMFMGVMLMAQASNCSQILVHSIRWKDLFGTNQQLRHDLFFDVVHWNSYHPSLPRFVTYDEELFQDLIISNPQDMKPSLKWNVDDPYSNAKHPFAIGQKRTDAIMKFYDYTKDVEKGRSERQESELLVLKGALRPHPGIRDIMTTFKKHHNMTNIMVLHARIEPDMQKHNMCKEYKVLNITDIVEMLHKKYPEPPVSTVLIILNRSILETEVNQKTNENEMAFHNLKILNEIISKGLWNGRVKVVEAGSELAKQSEHPMYAKYSSLAGSIINFFLSLEAEIFVGTIVSSYSTALVSYRFFREKKQNYFYMPHGLDWVTSPDVKQPPRFAC